VTAIGSHGRNDLSTLIVRSVTQKVRTHSRIPVLVYRGTAIDFASSNGGRLSKTVAGAIRPAQVSKPNLNPQLDKQSDMKTEINLSYQSPVQDHRHAGSTAQGAATVTKSARYTCTMHPEVIRDAPGSCPKCGMTLVPLRE